MVKTLLVLSMVIALSFGIELVLDNQKFNVFAPFTLDDPVAGQTVEQCVRKIAETNSTSFKACTTGASTKWHIRSNNTFSTEKDRCCALWEVYDCMVVDAKTTCDSGLDTQLKKLFEGQKDLFTKLHKCEKYPMKGSQCTQ